MRSRDLTGWRFFPWYLGGALGVVGLVNAGLVWAAIASFPGLATEHSFDVSNSYDRVLDAARQQAALGWTVRHSIAGDGRLTVTLAGPDGLPLAGASLTAVAERPVGPAEPMALTFHPTELGRFEADTPVGLGRWNLDLTVTAALHSYRTVRRLVVK